MATIDRVELQKEIKATVGEIQKAIDANPKLGRSSWQVRQAIVELARKNKATNFLVALQNGAIALSITEDNPIRCKVQEKTLSHFV